MRKIEFHPIANLFPMLAPDDLESLAEDIKANGLQQSIVLYEDKILDGRNRYNACIAADVQLHTEHYAGDDPVGHVLSLNLHRRHLTASQRAVIGQNSLPLFEAEAKKRQQGGQGGVLLVEKIPQAKPTKSRDEVAKLFDVNPRYVSDAKKLQKQEPAALDRIMSGETNINQELRKLKKPEPVPGKNMTMRTVAKPAPGISDIPGFNGKFWASILPLKNRASDLMRNLNDNNFLANCNEAEALIIKLKKQYNEQHNS